MIKDKGLILLGRYIKACRLKAGMTQKDLYSKMDRSQPWIAQIECGVRSPAYQDLVQICLIIGADEKICVDLLPARRHQNIEGILKEINEFKSQKKAA